MLAGNPSRPVRREGRRRERESLAQAVRRLAETARPANWHAPARLGSGPMRSSRLALARFRRPLAVLLILLALWVTVRSAAPAPPPQVELLVAVRDLPAGHRLAGGDLQRVSRPEPEAPAGRLAAGEGLSLAVAMRSGEPLTDTRVLGPGLLTGAPAGLVAVPVRLGDPAAAALVHPGDRVDVLRSSSPDGSLGSLPTAPEAGDIATRATDDAAAGLAGDAGAGTGPAGAGTGAARIATAALVLAIPGAGGDWSGDGDVSGLGGLIDGAGDASGGGAAGVVVLAVHPGEAELLTAAQTGAFIGIAVLPRP